MDILKWTNQYAKDCKLKYNSEATQHNYISQVKSFLHKFKNHPEPKAVKNEDIKEWVLEAKTINTRRHRLCALNSFYSLSVKMPNKIKKIPYPKSNRKLPIVLSVEEVQKMFDVCENKKHKVILALLYSTGMRVSELINLQWKDIDRSRMVINIIQGKGKKDRQVPLSNHIITLLEEYWKQYKPEQYVLNGQFDLKYSARSVLAIMKQLSDKAGIKNKRVYTHLMRHNAFTHMVEEGLDINLIQRLAGHNNVKTTAIYTHISHNLISKIKTPIESIRI